MTDTILDKILNEIETSDIDLKVYELCKKIQEEEDSRNQTPDPKYRPNHQNIFLVLHIKRLDSTKYNYIALERERPEKYIISLWTKSFLDDKPTPAKRSVVWQVNESKPDKILKEFAKIYMIYK